MSNPEFLVQWVTFASNTPHGRAMPTQSDVAESIGRGRVNRMWQSHSLFKKAIETLRLLLEPNADINKDTLGSTALSWAATNSYVDTVWALLEHKLDVNKVDTLSCSIAQVSIGRRGLTRHSRTIATIAISLPLPRKSRKRSRTALLIPTDHS
ncbi:uncharacterized protein BDR25DRAFT_312124 [Lindgomyces ingoldianus]|uniref:Uncharacterized protein n=1 Tax=Lindgomyces ingoldianus TaxID=673940 RepID=A0ACB6R545_9PLEO|nr:uncharacterized protein BDR25DRAFT_312124 [Lindgomyces ingoldianus]KAF2473963.1 hypothetical protein BDR25DRAFT_312124 [Lindgomyces ingoldianus]